MYMKPTLLLGGSFLFSQASIHSIAFRSAHIGSGPGVLGLSAMHVNWLLPFRPIRIFPSDPTSMIVAPFPIASGAADMALLMSSSSVIFPEGILCCWATAKPETRTTEHPNVSATCRMKPSPQKRKRDHSTFPSTSNSDSPTTRATQKFVSWYGENMPVDIFQDSHIPNRFDMYFASSTQVIVAGPSPTIRMTASSSFGAIPMDLLAEMGDECTCRHRHGIGRIE